MTGPTMSFGLVGGPDLDGTCGLDEPGEESVMDSLQHDDPRAGRAFLARVAERALNHAHHGLVEVGVVIDNDRVLAAHLGDHALDMVLAGPGVGGLAIDQQADIARARESDQVNAGMVDEPPGRPPRPGRSSS